MSVSKEYIRFVLEQLSRIEDVTYRPMMGGYVIYYQKKIVGGIYDTGFLVKPVKSAVALMPAATRELPYPGGKEMLAVEDPEDITFLHELFRSMYDELPEPKKKKSAAK